MRLVRRNRHGARVVVADIAAIRQDGRRRLLPRIIGAFITLLLLPAIAQRLRHYRYAGHGASCRPCVAFASRAPLAAASPGFDSVLSTPAPFFATIEIRHYDSHAAMVL